MLLTGMDQRTRSNYKVGHKDHVTAGSHDSRYRFLLWTEEQKEGWKSLNPHALSSQHTGILAVQSLHSANSHFFTFH